MRTPKKETVAQLLCSFACLLYGTILFAMDHRNFNEVETHFYQNHTAEAHYSSPHTIPYSEFLAMVVRENNNLYYSLQKEQQTNKLLREENECLKKILKKTTTELVQVKKRSIHLAQAIAFQTPFFASLIELLYKENKRLRIDNLLCKSTQPLLLKASDNFLNILKNGQHGHVNPRAAYLLFPSHIALYTAYKKHALHQKTYF